MNSISKKSLQKKSNFLQILSVYLILIPFFYPSGFSESNIIYKRVQLILIVISVSLVVLKLIVAFCSRKVDIPKCLFVLILYYLILIVETVMQSTSPSLQGIQKLFVAPFVSIYLIIGFRRDRDLILQALKKIMLFIFVLNTTIFNPLIFKNLAVQFGYHVNFLGHVQISSTLGIVGLLVAFLLYKNNGNVWKLEDQFLVIFSSLTMIISGTMASLLSLLIIFLGYLFSKSAWFERFLSMDSRKFVLLYLFADFLLMWFAFDNNGDLFLGRNITFSARTFIWRDIFTLLRDHWKTGYGAYGIFFKMFWTEDTSLGMNYAHNEILQIMLDGGVVLLIVFLLMLFSYLSRLKYLKTWSFKYVANLFLSSMLFIMLFESVTEYVYFFVFITLLACAPLIEENGLNIVEGTIHETN